MSIASCFAPRVVPILNTLVGSPSSKGTLQISLYGRPFLRLYLEPEGSTHSDPEVPLASLTRIQPPPLP
ncbi:hypothetical protein LIER_41284 [Lithospermum erythrorhizon]|uniref:Uncharacterized protein n=1 Tax=Lithospermum erythrorhizon TaxID=34254 RepID=A0AAV3R6Y3_LITER